MEDLKIGQKVWVINPFTKRYYEDTIVHISDTIKGEFKLYFVGNRALKRKDILTKNPNEL